MKESVLRKLLMASLGFGLVIGAIFPFFADLFVTWKPGMYVWFSISALAAGAVVGAVNYWLVNLILVSRLKRIAEVATAIGSRDLTLRCSMVSDDTVGEIIDAFNRMAATLRELIGGISTLSGEVENDTRSIQQLVGDVRDRVTVQNEDTRQIVAALENMRRQADEVSETARQVADSTDRALQVARDGSRVVAETVDGMGQIERTVSQAAADVNTLGQRSDEIGAIVAVIRGIAEQTNLLALNAAIEAARAGEQGRGFAVVADEVRKLAEKTGAATEEIGQVIGGIQGQVRQTVVSMDESRAQVQAGVSRAEKAGQSLTEILESIQGVSAMMARITELASEQQQVEAEVVRRAENIAAGVDATLGQMASCDGACGGLAGQSARLHEEVQRFRVA